MKDTVLIVEDETAIVHVLAAILTANDYGVLVADTGEQALRMSASHCPDVILLDLGLPGMDGMETLRQLRSWYGKPVLVVSARDNEKEKVRALDLGADDYITKPFGSSELVARIRAALRRSKRQGQEGAPPGQYAVGELLIDFDRHLVWASKKEVHLTQIEFKIVELLARHPGKVLTYDYIMKHIWGPFLPQDNKILRVNMANIRRKLEKTPAEPQYILTEVGIGYRMAEGEE